jgi:hypothetical protein
MTPLPMSGSGAPSSKPSSVASVLMKRPARSTFLELAQADALLADHARVMPLASAPYDQHVAWGARADQLAADRDRELAAVRRLLCWKCEGAGRTQWLHRSGGLCYACQGDGYSAAGRKAARR